jgi:plastocyanin
MTTDGRKPKMNTLAHTAASELTSDEHALARLKQQKIAPPAGATVQAGAAVGNVSVNQFFPSTVTIKAGQTVTWANPTPTGHVVMIDGGVDAELSQMVLPSPRSGGSYTSGFAHSAVIGLAPAPTRTYSLRFTRAGRYSVICRFHPGLAQTIIVIP